LQSPFGAPYSGVEMRLAALVAVASVILAQPAPPGGLAGPEGFDRSEQVAPGVTYRERRFWRGAEGPFTMQALEIQPSHPAVNLLAVRANDRLNSKETVRSMARRYGAVAAVNGGYFVVNGPFAGTSTGAWQSGKRPLYAGSGRSGLVFCEESEFVEHLEVSQIDFWGEARAGQGIVYPVAGLNRQPGEGELIVFQPEFGEATPHQEGVREVALDQAGNVIEVQEDGGATWIPPSGAVLSGRGSAAEWLEIHAPEGAQLQVSYELRAWPAACVVEDILGAGPRIVRDGKPSVSDEGFGHAAVRHPRTAAAITASGAILLVTVDGRQENSIGMRLDELAEELVAMGAREAVNLDGGGSTTMVVRGRTRNSPSDGQERPVSDGLLVFSIASVRDLEELLEKLVNNTAHIRPEHWPGLREALSRGPSEFLAALDALQGQGISPVAERLLREGAHSILVPAP
jgi:hypothetical protein